MMPFVKLDCGILDSSLWEEDAVTRVVFLTILAMTEPTGLCPSTAPGIARRANLPLNMVVEAIEKLEAPDQHSRTLDQGGRRIERVDGGYNVVNYLKYREKRLAEDRREQVREAVARHRSKNDVITCNQEKAIVSTSSSPSASTSDLQNSSSPPDEPAGFLDFWTVYPKKVGKGAARTWWRKHKPDAALAERITLAAVTQRMWKSWEDTKFIPHPITWLNQERWQDEPPEGPPVSLNQRGDASDDPLSSQKREQHEAEAREAMLTSEQREKNKRLLEEATRRFGR